MELFKCYTISSQFIEHYTRYTVYTPVQLVGIIVNGQKQDKYYSIDKKIIEDYLNDKLIRSSCYWPNNNKKLDCIYYNTCNVLLHYYYENGQLKSKDYNTQISYKWHENGTISSVVCYIDDKNKLHYNWLENNILKHIIHSYMNYALYIL